MDHDRNSTPEPKGKNENSSTEPLDTYFSEERVHIPEDDYGSKKFSFRKLWAFTGPGFIMSIAFLDPGNIESDLQSGTIAKYRLLWVLLCSTILGLVMQCLAMKLGVVTGLHLAEMSFRNYRKYPRLILWIMIEIAIIGSDIQEVIGTSIAIYILSSKYIPLWGGCIITVLDTFTFLLIGNHGLRKLELFFAILIGTMAITFGYEYALAQPNQVDVLEGIFIPSVSNWTPIITLQAIGIVGATIMPHNLYFHSALVKSRDIDRTKSEKVKEALFYFTIESTAALMVSVFINVFIVAVFADGLFNKTNAQLLSECNANSINASDIFPNNTEYVTADLYKGGIFLGCSFGITATYIWALGVLAAGQSSTMTGTYTGQFAMEGFLNLHWAKWKRVLFTRSAAIVPTFCIAFFSSISEMSVLNDFMNALMSVQLPFALIPVIAFTSNPKIMGKFVNGWFHKLICILISVIVIAINTHFVLTSFYGTTLQLPLLCVIIFISVFYIIFCLYLTLHMVASFQVNCLSQLSFVKKYVLTEGVEEENSKL